jgi:vanillate O-demethylase ferredoxin subunit
VSDTRVVRVRRIAVEAQDVCSFELADPEGRSLPAFTAGSHIDVQLEDGLVRQYSLCNDPRETQRYLIAVLREPASRGGSAAMHALREGQTLRIGGPRNHFALAAGAAHHLLLAGGIGITPLLCMAERLIEAGDSFELHYSTRSAVRAAFAERIRTSSFADRANLYHDDGPAAQRLDIEAVLAAQPEGTHLYVCGPKGFMDAVLVAGRAAGWHEPRLHREYFAGAPLDTTGDGAFEVQVASSGAVIRVAPEQSIVAALSAAGVQVPVSCEQGVCGTCLTRVIDGVPDHRDLYLTDEEHARGDQMTLCCSRAKSSRLILGL